MKCDGNQQLACGSKLERGKKEDLFCFPCDELIDCACPPVLSPPSRGLGRGPISTFRRPPALGVLENGRATDMDAWKHCSTAGRRSSRRGGRR